MGKAKEDKVDREIQEMIKRRENANKAFLKIIESLEDNSKPTNKEKDQK